MPVSLAFTRVHKFIGTYSALDPDDQNIAAVWAMGTWCFSPACKWPATFPYLYVTGAAGSGKSIFGMDVMRCLCRHHQVATGATGATLFRMLGRFDEETGIIENDAPTLAVDEIDSTFAGAKDEDLRRSLNVGYKQSGSTIPRSMGKTTIDFPVYGPKILLGIDNGHLPETVVTRAVRIDLRKHTSDELGAMGVQEMYSWEVDDEATDIQQMLSDWAKANSMVLRDYRPEKPEGLTGRQWEIGRTLLQLAHAIGNEAAIRKSLVTILNRAPVTGPAALYTAVFHLFNETGLKTLTTNQILDRLTQEGIAVPGQSGTGLSKVLAEEGIAPRLLRLPEGHPGIPDRVLRQSKRNKHNQPSNIQRGYQLLDFDRAFAKHVIIEQQ
jgi:hypothetical protein